jgi:hypothetical protein
VRVRFSSPAPSPKAQLRASVSRTMPDASRAVLGLGASADRRRSRTDLYTAGRPHGNPRSSRLQSGFQFNAGRPRLRRTEPARWSSLDESGPLRPEWPMGCWILACAAQQRHGVMKENLYFWATLAMAARSSGLSGGPVTPRLPGLPISGNMPSMPAGEYMNSILAGPSPTFW